MCTSACPYDVIRLTPPPGEQEQAKIPAVGALSKLPLIGGLFRKAPAAPTTEERKGFHKQDEARGKAVADARAKAEDLARLHGAELGSVLKIAEVGYSNEPIARMLNHSANSGGVIRSGEMQVSVKLKVVYELR